MVPFTIELVFNAFLQLFANNTLSSFTNFLQEQVILEGQWEVATSEICYPAMYQNVTEGKFVFYDEKLSKTREAYYLQPGLFSSITDIVEAMNTLIQETDNHRDTCTTIKIDRVTQKVKVYLANEDASLAIFSTDLGHGKGAHEPTFSYDIVRIHSLRTYTDIVVYNIVGDTTAPLLRCFPFISNLKSGVIITTGQYMIYQTFSKLQFRRLLGNSFLSIHIDLRGTPGEKIPFASVGITRLVLLFRKVFDIPFY